MSESPAVCKARAELEAVKAKLGGDLKFGEAAELMAEYNRLCAFIYYRTSGRPPQKNREAMEVERRFRSCNDDRRLSGVQWQKR
jgi:hypothetical protein